MSIEDLPVSSLDLAQGSCQLFLQRASVRPRMLRRRHANDLAVKSHQVTLVNVRSPKSPPPCWFLFLLHGAPFTLFLSPRPSKTRQSCLTNETPRCPVLMTKGARSCPAAKGEEPSRLGSWQGWDGDAACTRFCDGGRRRRKKNVARSRTPTPISSTL